MTLGEQTFHQIQSDCTVEKLPDGSTVVFDSGTQTLHSLNAPAAAAFKACGEPKTLPELAQAMAAALSSPVDEELALAAVAELEQAGLVAAEGEAVRSRQASRRHLLKAAGVALPLVLSLTAAQQRAYAYATGSGGPP